MKITCPTAANRVPDGRDRISVIMNTEKITLHITGMRCLGVSKIMGGLIDIRNLTNKLIFLIRGIMIIFGKPGNAIHSVP